MILYSIVPAEIVFQGTGYLDGIKYFEAEYMGVRITAAQMPDKSYVISRILDTSPQLFLNPALQPGNTIDGSLLKPF